ncbi:MAG TPA: hypothetical protein VGJ15_05765, partial [Pirellulales bacterium]
LSAIGDSVAQPKQVAQPKPHVDEDLASAMEALAGGILPLSKSGSGPAMPPAPSTVSKPAAAASGAAAKWANPTPPVAKTSPGKSSGVQSPPGSAPGKSSATTGTRAAEDKSPVSQASIEKSASPSREDRTSQWKHPPKAPAEEAKPRSDMANPAADVVKQPERAEKSGGKSETKAALALAAIAFPPVEAAVSPLQSQSEPQPQPTTVTPVGGDAWPRWFLPSAAGTVVVGVVIIVLRMLLHGDAPAPNVASNPSVNSATDAAANSTGSANTNSATLPPESVDATANAAAKNSPVDEQTPPAIDAAATKQQPDAKDTATATDGVYPAVDPVVPSKDVPPPVPEPNSSQVAGTADGSSNAGGPNGNANLIVPRPSMDVPPPTTPTTTAETPPAIAAGSEPKTDGLAPVADAEGAFPNAGSFSKPNNAAAVIADPRATSKNAAAGTATNGAATNNAAGNGAPINAAAANSQPTVQRSLTRMPPRMVNVNARLADPAPALEVRGIALADYLALVSDFSAIPITLDADAALELGQSPAVAVKAKLANTTIADVLEAALDPLGLGYQARDGQLLVGFPPQEKMRLVRYVVTDLVGDDPQALANFGTLVRRLVAPASWQQAGGRASMVAGNGLLAIEQTEAAHAGILTLCEKLRIARGLPQKSKFDPARFVLSTRADKAHEMLAKPLRANFNAPQSLASVVKWIHQTTGAIVLVDHAALAGQGISAESECTAAVVDQPLAELIEKLAASLDLTWRAIDERTIEITSKPAAAARMDVEFYPVARMASDAGAAQSLIRNIQAKVAPQLWGDKPQQGTIVFDSASKALLVRAPQRVQAEVEALLNSSGK